MGTTFASVFTVATVLMLIMAPSSFAKSLESVHTKLDIEACSEVGGIIVQTDDLTRGGGTLLECQGLNNIKVYATFHNHRFDVDYGVRRKVFESFTSFNAVGENMEWRLSEGDPIAVLHPHELYDTDGDPEKVHQVIKVSKVGTTREPGCPVAYVDAKLNANAAAMARDAADRVGSFDCEKDKPAVLGHRGPLQILVASNSHEIQIETE